MELMTVNFGEPIHMTCPRLSPKALWELREPVKAMEEASKVVSEVYELIEVMCYDTP